MICYRGFFRGYTEILRYCPTIFERDHSQMVQKGFDFSNMDPCHFLFILLLNLNMNQGKMTKNQRT